MLCAKVSGIAGLQTLLVAGRKYMVKGCPTKRFCREVDNFSPQFYQR